MERDNTETARGDSDFGDFNPDNTSEKLADALARFAEFICEVSDLKSDSVQAFLDANRHLEGFADLATECLRLEAKCRIHEESALDWKALPSVSDTVPDAVVTRSRPISTLWLCAIGLMIISTLLCSIVTVGIWQRRSADIASAAFQAGVEGRRHEVQTALAEVEKRDRRLESAAVREESLRREFAEASDALANVNTERSNLVENNAKLTSALTNEKDARARAENDLVDAKRSELRIKQEQDALQLRLAANAALYDDVKKQLDKERSELARLRDNEFRWRMNARRNGGPGPLVIATHALGMVGDATNLALSSRANQSPELKKRLQELISKSTQTSEQLLTDAADIIGSEGGAEETRALYVNLRNSVVDYNKELQGLRKSVSEAPPAQPSDQLALVALNTYGYKSQLHALQIHQASGWIKSVYGDSHISAKILQLADSTKESARVLANDVHRRPNDKQLSSIQNKSQTIISAFEKLTRAKGPSNANSDVKATSSNDSGNTPQPSPTNPNNR